MKPTSEILERIERCSSEHKGGIFTRLYRCLLREDIYYAAYQKLYANKGATTQGIDDDAGRAGGHAAYDRRFLSAVRAEQHQRRGAKAAFDAVRVILAR